LPLVPERRFIRTDVDGMDAANEIRP